MAAQSPPLQVVTIILDAQRQIHVQSAVPVTTQEQKDLVLAMIADGLAAVIPLKLSPLVTDPAALNGVRALRRVEGGA